METTVENENLVKLPVEDRDGRTYTLRFDGVCLASSSRVEVYQTDDERIIVYESNRLHYYEVEDPEEELRDWLDQDSYIEVMNSLGITPEVDL